MTWTAAGLELINATSGVLNLNFAQNKNQIIMSDKGNKVISGYVATVNGSSDLTTSQTDVDVTAGSALIDGTVRTNGSALTISLDTFYNALTTGQAQYIYLYLTDAATPVLTAVGGTAGTGTIYPPDIPEDVVTITLIYIIESTTVLVAGAIRDYRIYSSNGEIYGDNNHLYFGDDGDLDIYHDSSNSYIINSIGGLYIQNQLNNIYLDTGRIIYIRDIDDSSVALFNFDTTARTFVIGASADLIESTFYGDIIANGGSSTARVRLKYAGSDTDQLLIYKQDLSSVFVTLNSDPILFQINSVEILDINTGGIDITGDVKNQVDNAGFYTGINDDLRMYHDGTNNYFDAQNTPNDNIFQIRNSFKIMDFDDGGDKTGALLFDFNTTSRTFTIGASGDEIAMSVHGTYGISEYVSLYPNFRNLTGWSFNSTDDYLTTVSNQIDEDCIIYIDLKSHVSEINAEIEYTLNSAGAPTYTGDFAINLEVLNSGGTWTNVSTDTSSPVSGVVVTATVTLSLTSFGTIEVGNHYRLRFEKKNHGATTALLMKLFGIEVVY